MVHGKFFYVPLLFGESIMIALRDVSIYDEGTYAVWQHDLKLTDYLSRLCHGSGVCYKYEKLPLYIN